jgi:hypothetical protein
LLFVRGSSRETVRMQPATEAVKFTLESGCIEAEVTLQTEDLEVVCCGSGLDFAAIGAEKSRCGERGIARPTGCWSGSC